jgi:hypothetical protein
MNLEHLNKRYGRWVILEFSHVRKSFTDSGRARREYIWRAVCDCGTTRDVDIRCIKAGGSKSCGCLHKERVKRKQEWHIKPKAKASLVSLFNRYRYRATERGYSFSLTLDFFEVLTKLDCYYCGDKPRQVCKSVRTYKNGGAGYVYNGVDRLDNKIGYNTANCVPCCGLCNKMKLNKTVDEFKEHITKVYKRLTK